MKYYQPLGTIDGTGYSHGDPDNNILGSVPPAQALEHPQREIENVITSAGLTPDSNDLNQLNTAVQSMVTNGATGLALADLSNVASADVVSKIGNSDIVASDIASASISTDKFADDAITLSHFAHGTAGKVIGFDGAGLPVELDPILPQIDLQDAFATKVLVDLDVSEAINSYGTYYLQDMSQGGMTITGGGMHISGSGYSWGTEVNIASSASVVVTSYLSAEHDGSKLIDGNTSTSWSSISNLNLWPVYVMLDFSPAVAVDRVEILPGDLYDLGPFTLQVSNDGGSTFTDIVSHSGGTYGSTIPIDITGGQSWSRYRLKIDSAYNPADKQTSISEIRLFQTAAAGEAVFTSSGVSLVKANPSDIALYVLIDEGGAVTEGTDRIFELADGSGLFVGTYETPTEITDLGLFLGKRMIRATFDMSSKPATSCTYRIKLNNVEQTISSAVVVPLYY